jgi:hypothetical protein
MANSDYTVRAGNYGFCPFAFLALPIGALHVNVTMVGYTSPITDGIRIGMAAMIDSEIIVIYGRTGNELLIGRGCCDTVPAPHEAGAIIAFFDDSIARDGVEYGGTETVAVKVLPRTTSAPYLPVSSSPPQQVGFNFRFARPYPPGLVRVNGNAWILDHLISNLSNFALTWAHRDRLTQEDLLVDHMQANIGPEVGTTYTIQIFKADGTLLRSTAGISADNWLYPWTTAVSDFGVGSGLHEGYATLRAVRDALDSFQHYRIDFTLDAEAWGLGFKLGTSLGGISP